MLYFAGPGDSYLYLCLSLYCLVMGAVTSYARARAESLGMEANGGIAERADRTVAILLATGFSDWWSLPILLEVTLWALAVAITVTVLQRVLDGAPAGDGRGPGRLTRAADRPSAT